MPLEARVDNVVLLPVTSGRTMTLDQIRSAGMHVLARELGPVGMVRFLQQFETGNGNYSVERHDRLDDSGAEEWVKRILSHKQSEKSQ